MSSILRIKDEATGEFVEVNAIRGSSGIHYGTEPPTDPEVSFWVNPESDISDNVMNSLVYDNKKRKSDVFEYMLRNDSLNGMFFSDDQERLIGWRKTGVNSESLILYKPWYEKEIEVSTITSPITNVTFANYGITGHDDTIQFLKGYALRATGHFHRIPFFYQDATGYSIFDDEINVARTVQAFHIGANAGVTLMWLTYRYTKISDTPKTKEEITNSY